MEKIATPSPYLLHIYSSHLMTFDDRTRWRAGVAKPIQTKLNGIFLRAVTIIFVLFTAACGGGSSSSSSDSASPYEGYNLYTPLSDTTTWLVDNDGNAVHSWTSDYRPGLAVYLLDNGELLRTGNVGNTTFDSGGAGGIIESYDLDGNLTWSYEYAGTTYLQHHDIARLPNGNVLLIAWEYKTGTEATDAGRVPSTLGDNELWPDSIIEVEPDGASGGTIIWEWHVWDHLVQDYDASKANYGTVADHPELINLNYTMNTNADWTHINGIDYNADLDQILLSVHNFSEIWIIDHSTTTAEAAGHSGGSYDKGGDLLYRWGNPQTYDAGDSSEQKLFVQHDAEWIDSGLPGEDDILIFNNGKGRSDGDYSSIDEITPPVNAGGSYTLESGNSYGPSDLTWQYIADTPTDFYAQSLSSAQRLPNGNTLICSGPDGYFFEVTSSGETVWDYSTGGAVFRVYRYGSDYAGFDGTSLDDGS